VPARDEERKKKVLSWEKVRDRGRRKVLMGEPKKGEKALVGARVKHINRVGSGTKMEGREIKGSGGAGGGDIGEQLGV